LNSGHYFGYFHNGNQWSLRNDLNVTDISNAQLVDAMEALRTNTATHMSVPYILLYDTQDDVLQMRTTSVATTSNAEEDQADAAAVTAGAAVAAATAAAETAATVAKATSLVYERFRPLSSEDVRAVQDLLNGPSSQEVVREKESTQLTRETMVRFRECGFMNGDIISYIFLMLQERDASLCTIFLDRKKSLFLNTFFLEDGIPHANSRYIHNRRVNINIFDLDKIFIPIHHRSENHWTLAVVVMKMKSILYYDSMGALHSTRTNAIMEWIKVEAQVNNTSDFNERDWQTILKPSPGQTNGYDCGIFVITNADFISDDIEVSETTYTQGDIPFLRFKFANDILKGQFHYPLVSPSFPTSPSSTSSSSSASSSTSPLSSSSSSSSSSLGKRDDANKKRDSDEVETSRKKARTVARHTVGLMNEGNSCYINVWIQCLYSVIGNTILTSVPTCIFMTHLKKFFYSMQSTKESTLRLSYNLLQAFRYDHGQEDTMESMQRIFPREDLPMFNFTTYETKTETGEVDIFYRNSDELTKLDGLTIDQQHWLDVAISDNVFTGDTLHASNFNLDLAIDMVKYSSVEHAISLDDVVRDNFRHQRKFINWYDDSQPVQNCQGCKEIQTQCKVHDPPENLIIRLKVFYYSLEGRADKYTFPYGIHIPLELQFHNTWYTLWSIIVHEGASVNAGHYWAYTRSAASPTTWLECNDSTITVLENEPKYCSQTSTPKQLDSQTPYVIIYKKTSCSSASSATSSSSSASSLSAEPSSSSSTFDHPS